MRVVFGLWADGGASPDHGGSDCGASGAPVVGPIGLIDLLETSLGIGGPPASQLVRIAAFQAALERAGEGRFWSRSFDQDPWATAKKLITWRDALTAIGWQPQTTWSSRRLNDLAAASAAADLPPGLADRMACVIEALGRVDSAPFASLRLIDERGVLPSPIRRLIARLETLGVDVTAIPVAACAAEGSALGVMQRWMIEGTKLSGAPDQSVTVARSSSTPLAAELLGQWLAEEPQGTVAIVAQEADTFLLDHGLSAAGQPRAGRSASSPHRGSLQLLLLAFRSAWTPFDAHALMELLVFPSSPVPRRASGRLAAALEQAPGLGSTVWQDAWTAIAGTERRRSEDAGEKPALADKRLALWRDWAEPLLADPETGMALGQATAICDRVSDWARRRFETSEDLLYLATARMAADVRNALIAVGRERLPRILIERMIDQALDIGEPDPGSMTEAARWRSTSHPGALWQPVETVIWWNFHRTSEGTQRAPWSDEERRELAGKGCPADDIALEGRAVSQAWERAVLNASERLILVTTGLDCEEDESAHPLAHRLSEGLEKLADRVSFEAALTSPVFRFAGTELVRTPVAALTTPVARSSWPTPAAFSGRLAAVTESASSLESLLSCQLRWALRHVARLRPGRVRSIPDANRLLGNLAHSIARDVFPPGPPPHPDAARQRTAELAEARIDEIAAPLRYPEHAEDLSLARRRLPEAMAGLARTLLENKLTVEATELQVSRTFEELLAVSGSVDLVARDSDGNAVIFDLKWTRSERTRIAELKSGAAVQLATYGAMVSPDTAYRAGYYLLNQRQFATLTGSGLVGRAVDSTRSFPETWNAIYADWRARRGLADSGTLVAAGVEGADGHFPFETSVVREVRCDQCDYSTLCRTRGLV